jgi:hypothetical protein
MPFLARSLLILPIVLAGIRFHLAPASAPAMRPADRGALATLAVRLGRLDPAQKLAAARRSPQVRAAVLGRDGATIDLTFRDDTTAAILPAAPPIVRRAPVRLLASSGTQAPGAQGRAAVLEPFLTELHLDAHTDDSAIASLRSAGFSVDFLSDTAVTVATMATLAPYRVIYLNTHSGVNQYGEGVIATGEVAASAKVGGDPAADALVKEGTAMIVAVSGSDTLYYGLKSGYFRQYEPAFAPGSLVFINGCSLLRATLFWDALSAHGLATFVSWDNPVAPPGDSTAAALVLASLSTGRTVDEAVADAVRAGYGWMVTEGQKAILGYRGDGGLQLIPDTPSPTSTPTPTASPTSTPTPESTATPIASPTPSPTRKPTQKASTTPSPKKCSKSHHKGKQRRCKGT